MLFVGHKRALTQTYTAKSPISLSHIRSIQNFETFPDEYQASYEKRQTE